ncbi:MAG: hypothetical protein ACP5VP_06100 [Candidatus Limnocylindrales bacterium]
MSTITVLREQPPDYAELSQRIAGAITLTKAPVAVKLFDDPHAVPEGLPRPASAMYYCAAVGLAMGGETILLRGARAGGVGASGGATPRT